MQSRIPGRFAGKQRGQSTTEYIIGCAVLALALFAPLPPDQKSNAEMLADALRQSYFALSYFLSVP
jgi:hypothetical protein